MVRGVAGGGQKVEEQPEKEGMVIGCRAAGAVFVDEPGRGEGEGEKGGHGETEEVDPGRGLPGGDGFGHAPDPPGVGSAGEGFEVEIEDDGEQGGEAEDPKAVFGSFAPGPEDEAGNAAGTEDGSGPDEGQRPGQAKNLRAEVVGEGARAERDAGFGVDDFGDAGQESDGDGGGEDVLGGKRPGQREQGGGEGEYGKKRGSADCNGRLGLREHQSDASGGAGEEGEIGEEGKSRGRRRRGWGHHDQDRRHIARCSVQY